jgi:probable rRNA maturation factor
LPNKYFELGISLVSEAEMTQLNADFMGHKGTTDVIALDYCEATLAGDIFVCIDEACVQAKRFHTTWQSEVIRYIVHGVLHLSGYDDRRVADRRRMKETEDGLVAELGRRFRFSELGSGRKSELRRSNAERRPKSEIRSRVRRKVQPGSTFPGLS